MKHCLLLFAALVLSGAASAQRLRLGVRAGMNTSDYRFSTVRIGDTYVSRGGTCGIRRGAGLPVRPLAPLPSASRNRLRLRQLRLPPARRGRARRAHTGRTARNPGRTGLPIRQGAPPVRGAVFRATNSQRSSAPGIFRVKFNDGDVALTGGLGVQIRSFFLDFRITLHPQGRTWNTFTSPARSRNVSGSDATSSTAAPSACFSDRGTRPLRTSSGAAFAFSQPDRRRNKFICEIVK